jgi:8-oxo-dGTP pyrophosphatase MutT (NUDIX family)
MSSEELVQIVDNHNKPTRAAPRSEMRAQALPHRATYVLVFSAKGDVFVQKRTGTKDIFPGYYDVAAGGVVLAGEEYDSAAARELEEEMGVSGVPLQKLFDFEYRDQHNHVFGRAYACTWTGPMNLQAEEVESGEFCPVEDVLRRAKEGELFCPDGVEVLKRWAEGSEKRNTDVAERTRRTLPNLDHGRGPTGSRRLLRNPLR